MAARCGALARTRDRASGTRRGALDRALGARRGALRGALRQGRRNATALALAVAPVVALAPACCVAFAACAPLLGARPLATARPGQTTLHTLRVGGRTRSFLVHLPPAAATGRVPLVLAFHGHHGNASLMRVTTGLDAAADAFGVAVAYPNGTGPFGGWLGLSWNAATCCGRAHRRQVDDVAFADSLVARLGRALPVDTARVYATGFSNGGMLALLLACRSARTYDAVADVGGAMPDTNCRPARPVSVLLVQGTDDDELRADYVELARPNGHGYARSLASALRFWRRRAGCARGPAARDSTPWTVVARARGCPAGRLVEEITIRGNPHAWAGGEATWLLGPRPTPHVDASRLVLEFFARAAAARGGTADSLPSLPASAPRPGS